MCKLCHNKTFICQSDIEYSRFYSLLNHGWQCRMDWYRTWCQWRLCSLSFLKKNICRSEEKNLVWKGDESWCERASSTAPEMSSLWLPWVNLPGIAVHHSTVVNWNIFKFYPVKISGATVFEGERSGALHIDSSLCNQRKKKENTKQVRSWWRNSEIAELWNPGGRLRTQCTEQTQTPTSIWKIRPYHLKVNKSIIPPFQKQI